MAWIVVQGKKKLVSCHPVKFSYKGKAQTFVSKGQAEGFVIQIKKGKWSGLYRKPFQVVQSETE